MNKKKIKKYIWLSIILTIAAFFVNTCMISNIPHDLYIDSSNSITGYNNKPGWAYQYLKREIIPGRVLQVDFIGGDGFYFNTNDLELYGRLFISKQYEKINIKELTFNLNGKKRKLMENESYSIKELKEHDILVDEKDEPIIINGEKLYWTSVKFNKEITNPFVKRFMGNKKEIELIQIYSFDDEEIREEVIKYNVIWGGKKFSPIRMLSFFVTF